MAFGEGISPASLFVERWDAEVRDQTFPDGGEPDFALVLASGAGQPISYPFFKTHNEIVVFTDEMLRLLDDVEYRHRVREDDLAEGDLAEDGDLANDPALKSYKFLAEAMGDALDGLNAELAKLEADPEAANWLSVFDVDGLVVPWALLHPSEPNLSDDKTYRGFLGYRFLLFSSQASRDTSKPMRRPETAVLRGPIGFVDDPALAAVRHYFERRKLRDATGKQFAPLEPILIPINQNAVEPIVAGVSAAAPVAFTQAVADYLVERNWDVIHFACHGDFASGKPNLQIRYGHQVSPRALQGAIARARSHLPTGIQDLSTPLLFLNICQSVESSDKKKVAIFSAIGPRITIGALGKICDWSAAQFAVSFYDRIFAASSAKADPPLPDPPLPDPPLPDPPLPDPPLLGEAFWNTMRERLDLTGNPVNLLFVYRGSPTEQLG